MIYSITLALAFLVNLRSKSIPDIHHYVIRKYGEEGLKTYKSYYYAERKKTKITLDIDFLLKCKTYKVIPKFLKFKLYRKSLQTENFYRAWQFDLLDKELNQKKLALEKSCNDLNSAARSFQVFSRIDGAIFRKFVEKDVSSFRCTVTTTHLKKLRNLGIHNSLSPVNPSEVVHNYSSQILNPRVKTLLAFGLEFALPVHKLNFYKYFISFEKIAYNLKSFMSDKNFSDFSQKLKFIAQKYFSKFKLCKSFSPVISHDDIKQLRELSMKKELIICKPDKGRAVVVLNRSDYNNSMQCLISDRSKFEILDCDIFTYTQKIETKINNFLRKIKQYIGDELYKKLYVTGSSPGVLYGLPKIHKLDFRTKFQFRPIFAAYNAPSFNLAKYLVNILKPFTTNQFTTLNSTKFSEELVKIPNANSYHMASFDVENLFTNIPISETIDICLNYLYTSDLSKILGLSKNLFKQFLEMSVLNSFFLFNGILYRQKEGLGMGLPLGPTFANIFMCFHESVWLSECPSEFKPFLYRRYVDDIFLLFRSKSHVNPFFDYLNSKHPNIKFTLEHERDGKISFLDASIHRENNNFLTSVFRKSTFSGVGMSYFSFCDQKFKSNAVQTLLNRAYNVSSSYEIFHKEIMFLKDYFFKNGFPRKYFESKVKNFLDGKYCKGEATDDVQISESKYFVIPFIGDLSYKLRNELDYLFLHYFSNFKINIIFVNSQTIGSMFGYKDKLPKASRSSVVYQYSCSRCESVYVGSTLRALKTRVSEHAGRSVRTGQMLSSPLFSSVRIHAEQCDTHVSIADFKILDHSKYSSDLRILEAMYISKIVPNLNETVQSHPLNIVK